jgi:hypothetical protein
MIHVLLGEMPQTLRAILEHALRTQDDIVVLAGAAEGAPPDTPDIVILGPSRQDREAARRQIGRWLRARVLVVADAGRRTIVYELRPHRTEVSELSPDQLVATIREAAHRPAEVLP